MPNDDGGVSKALAGAKAALASANNSTVSARQSTYAPAAHQTGVNFAAQHGSDHTGGLAGEAQSAAAGIAAKADAVAAYKAAGN